MAERFTSLFRLPDNLYSADCPVIIKAGALLKDNESGRIIAQLKFKSISNEVISALKVTVNAYEPNGSEIEGVPSFTYLDLNVARGVEFGSKIPIFLPNPLTRRFSASVTEVTFSNGKTTKTSDKWVELASPMSLFDVLDSNELIDQYTSEVGNVNNAPTENEYIKYCPCGEILHKDEKICPKCGRDFNFFFSALNKGALEAHIEQRREEKARAREEEVRRRKEAKERELKTMYSLACSCMDRLDFDSARKQFVKLGEYLDSKEKIVECDYRKAKSMMKDESYVEAKLAFEKLGDYKDSKEKTVECQYLFASRLYKMKKYDAAIDEFNMLGDYSDSEEKIEECKEIKARGKKRSKILALISVVLVILTIIAYLAVTFLIIPYVSTPGKKYSTASQAMQSGEYASAKKIFVELGNYRDSKKKAAECDEFRYNSAVAIMTAEDYFSAKAEFDDLGEYKDSEEKAVECQNNIDYKDALSQMDSKNYEMAKATFEKLGDYKDSKKKATECDELRYKDAVAALEKGDYSSAINTFAALGDYKDSKVQAAKCQRNINYQDAVTEMEDGHFSLAKTKFTALGDFKDSKEKAVECQKNIDYNYAVSQMSSKNYETAKVAFERLGDFKDSKLKAEECDQIRYDNAIKLMDSGEYDSARTTFAKLGDFKDSKTKIVECDYRFAVQMMTSKSFISAKTLFEELGTYQKSKLYYNLCDVASCSYSLRYNKFVSNKASFLSNWNDENVRKVLLSDNIIEFFMIGAWTENNYVKLNFYLNENGGVDCSFSLPAPYQSASVKKSNIENQILIWINADKKFVCNVFRFDFIDANKVKVYCYSDGTTHMLSRL